MKLKNLHVDFKEVNPLIILRWLFVLAVVLRIIADYQLGRIGVHAGDLYPYRKLIPFPPYSVSVLYFEWILILSGCCLIIRKPTRIGFGLISLGFLMGMTQMYQHQKLLFFISSLVFSIDPPTTKSWSVHFVKYQIVIIYCVSVLHRIFQNFMSGEELSHALLYSQNQFTQTIVSFLISSPVKEISSTGLLILEVLLPIILFKWTKYGFILVLILHLFMAVFLRNVLPFSLLMIALSLCFFVKKDAYKN